MSVVRNISNARMLLWLQLMTESLVVALTAQCLGFANLIQPSSLAPSGNVSQASITKVTQCRKLSCTQLRLQLCARAFIDPIGSTTRCCAQPYPS